VSGTKPADGTGRTVPAGSRPPAGGSGKRSPGGWPAGARRLASAAGTWVKSLSYLPKWLVLGSAVGVIAGFGAVAFYEALAFATHVFLGLLAGYQVPAPAGEGGAAGSPRYLRPWVIPLVVAAGGLLSGFLVFTWAPEAEGHGTDAAIDAVHRNPRGIRLRAVVIKIIASALTIGSGGSGGREGPTAQISAGFGSLLARVLDLGPEDGRIAVSVGIGSGIGAIFSAPLGGAVLAADIVYRDDFETAALIPGIFSSVIAYAIFGAFLGYQPLFATPGLYHFGHPLQLLWFALLGVTAGFLGLAYSKTFYGLAGLSRRLPFSRKLRPALGGLLTGLIALALPQVLGTGYGWVQKGLLGQLTHAPLIIILALPLARILATALSIGTGGSGGVFGPGMVIGAFTGLAVWRILVPFAPGAGHDPAAFVVVGMMAVFGGIARAPLAVMIMVTEMTGSIAMLAPAMVAVAISTFIVRRFDDSIYRSQLRSRAESPASRMQFGLPLLRSVTVSSVASTPRIVLHAAGHARAALASLEAAKVPGAPVVDERGTYLGAVDRDRLAQRLGAGADPAVGSVLDAAAATVTASATANVGLDAVIQAGGHWVTVTDDRRRVVGILSVGDVVRGYRRAVGTSIGQMAQATTNAVVVEERVGPASPLAGVRIRDARLPRGCVVVTVQRGGEPLLATGSTAFQADDVVSMLASPETAEPLRRRIRGVPQAGEAGAVEGQDAPGKADVPADMDARGKAGADEPAAGRTRP
jgi:CIC family chloride channel protein